MARDPAFLFYSQDFYTGVATLNWEDRGKFISILCLMHQQGRMQEETIRFLVGSISVNLKSKFRIDENGFWYNERLEAEAAKRNSFTESRRLNGGKGGRPKKSSKKHKPIGKHMQNHMDNHMGNENEYVNDNVLNTNKETEIELWPTFDDFWDKYDKKVGKPKCIDLWAKIRQPDREDIMRHLDAYQMKDKQYRKDPERYLKNKVWQDEVILTNHGNTKTKRNTAEELAIDFAERVVRRANGEELQSGW